jgi:hypothetical protein
MTFVNRAYRYYMLIYTIILFYFGEHFYTVAHNLHVFIIAINSVNAIEDW